ncbi:nucleoside triphosphate pyrophosphatase [Phenylobacterium sp.]|jgi:septum formation protein|uniref:Maf family protein n=1 Tax=Phenylobacterium sp. TaxID=1871053 RepID=UPI000C88FB7B|nr:nucleoside triphosphate pyrophosphatase [Phenylobacterium sp.]MAK81491.1 septum formation protein Maf [Phenylobacterium sp.]|tara:strand:+ start:47 stop:640 length:594 start_codon:yes stop_codon:yes gene_type:complete
MTRIILASQSAARSQLLAGAGVAFDKIVSGVDEDLVKVRIQAEGGSPRAVAQALADIKAVTVSDLQPGLVIGADQTLEFDGALYDKAASLEEARARLLALRGQPHHLHSAVTLAKDGEVLWSETACATLTMRDFSEPFLDAYLDQEGEALLGSVGCYRLEGPGAQLFAQIEGDYFAILGLPLLGLLDQLRQRGALVP